MELSDEKVKEFTKRLLKSRMRILCLNGFYGLLLMHIIFALDENCNSAATDGERIYFNPEFLDSITDPELDYIIMHEILHVVLEHGVRTGERDSERFNKAADIVVNSTIMQSFGGNENKIMLHGIPCMHKTPDGQEGCNYTAEQVYEMLPETVEENKPVNIPGSFIGMSGGADNNSKKKNTRKKPDKKDSKNSNKKQDCDSDNGGTWDDHSKWKEMEEDDKLQDLWMKRLEDACIAMEVRDPKKVRGLIPAFALRLLNELRNPQIDWRKILNEFVQEEIVDYSFTPPDRRFDDGDFFLPDFNEKGDKVENILFMIDTSGSMSEEMITAAYSEVKGAIDQFDGKLKGWLGFFDAAVIPPLPFSDEDEFSIIRPKGGGGTDFGIIFEYVRKHMQDKLPASIIILTDGYAPFPKESMSMGIPILWLLNNDEVKPKWGKVARIKV